MDAIWLIKLALIVGVLHYLRIFGARSLVIYLAGGFVLAFLKPGSYSMIPEYILMMTIILFFAYVLSLSVYDFLRNFRCIKFESFLNKAAFERYGNFFFAMFVISSAISIFNFQFFVAIFFMLVFFVGLDIIRINAPGRGSGFLSYRTCCAALFLYFMFFNKFQVLWVVIGQSLFSCGLMFVFLFVRYFNVYPCQLDRLKAGMVPAETITRKGNNFVKANVPYISVALYFRKKIINKMLKREEIVTPFKPLTDECINTLRSKTDFDIVMIQRTVNLRIFLVLGIFASYCWLMLW